MLKIRDFVLNSLPGNRHKSKKKAHTIVTSPEEIKRTATISDHDNNYVQIDIQNTQRNSLHNISQSLPPKYYTLLDFTENEADSNNLYHKISLPEDKHPAPSSFTNKIWPERTVGVQSYLSKDDINDQTLHHLTKDNIFLKSEDSLEGKCEKIKSYSHHTYCNVDIASIENDKHVIRTKKTKRDALSLNFNINISNVSCSCDSTAQGCPHIEEIDSYSLPDCNDINNQNNPRCRSWIKTNPWLPSPKSDNPFTLTMSSSKHCDRKSLDADSDTHTVDSGVRVSSDSLNSSFIKSNSESFDSEIISKNKIRKVERKFKKLKIGNLPRKNSEYHNNSSIETINEVGSDEVKEDDSLLSDFAYEKAFESNIEALTHGCIISSSHDSISDGYCSNDEMFLGSGSLRRKMEKQLQKNLQHKQKIHPAKSPELSSSEEDSVWQTRGCRSPYSDNKGYTSTDNFSKKCKHLKQKPSNSDTINYTKYNEKFKRKANRYNQKLYSIANIIDETNMQDLWETQSMADSGMSSVRSEQVNNVQSISSRLRQNICHLYEENQEMESKFHALFKKEHHVQKEDLSQCHHKIVQRKEVLLKTIDDMKNKLYNQNEKLQNSYSSILYLRQSQSSYHKHTSV